jgi:hypothetical protein
MLLHKPITNHLHGRMIRAVDGNIQKRTKDTFSYFDKAGLQVEAQLFVGEAIMAESNGLGEIITPREGVECRYEEQ